MMVKYALLSAGLLIGICASAQDVPKVEVPIGFSFVNVHPNQPAITSFNVFGGGVGFVYNFTPMIGVKGDFMGYTQGTGQRVTENGQFVGNVSGNLFTYMFGPQIKKHSGKIQPFGEALFGGAHTNLDANLCEVLGTCTSGTGSNNGFAMEFGVGLDIPITRHIQFRPVEVDYLYTHFGSNHIAGASASQNNFKYFGGINFTFGGAPPLPLTATCTVSPTQIMAGDPVSASVATQNFNPKHTVTYAWASTGGQVSGTTETASVATAGLRPGNYTVSVTATDEKKKNDNTADCGANFTVKQPLPPTASCSASPSTVKAGDPATLTVTAQSPDGSELTYTYATSAGRISGTGSSATLDTTGAPAGSPITATAVVSNVHGLTANCEAVVNVAPLPTEVVQEVTKVGECSFNNSNKPGRVDNECKATLDQVALLIQKEPNDSYVVVGYAEDDETTTMTQLAGQRAVNVKYYLTQGEGGQQISPSMLQVKAGAEKTKAIRIYRVPSGAAFTEQTTTVDETQVQGQSRSAPAKKHHKKAAADSTAPTTQQ
jgi:hypothetical protein